ncbi:MAG: COR domain-containing protein [Xenococcaceae cyanobacterium MO_188.B32]|nr:COR domain-containing protein [Xenococcaceae cyanobacterium MO_188.B32]
MKKWIHDILKSTSYGEQDKSKHIIPERFLEKIKEAKERELEALDLSSYDLDDREKLTIIPDEVFELTHLKSLNLSHNILSDLPDFFANLPNLIFLYLSNNNLSKLPPSFTCLSNLSTLDLSENRLSSLPDFFGDIISLTTLDLRGNKLSSLPSSFRNLSNLTTLYLSYNKLSALPNSLFALSNLNALYLSHNQIFALPDYVDELSNLTTLYLRDNQIYNLPNSIVNLNKLNTLDLRGNPLETPPMEVVIHGVEAIKKYFRKLLAEEEKYIYEAKVLIIGEAGAGKTTLAKKIKNPDYKLYSRGESTKGINLTQYSFPLNNRSKEFKVNIWDFGGQEIYHATHQFFLTKRSLYILVVDDRKNNDNLYYWLSIVKVLSNNSPLLIVKNEKGDRPIEIKNEFALRKKFTNIKQILATNLATNRGLEEVITQVKHYINDLEHIGKPLPLTWSEIRQALEQEQRYYISLDEFLQICQEYGLTRLNDKLKLSAYLHDLGVCLHFQERTESLLYKTVILKPTWATDAVYKVLDNQKVINNKGYFTLNDLHRIWYEDKYALMRNELLELMIKFQLCYQLPNNNNTFIAPQLLGQNKPQYPWDNSNNLVLRYKYKYFMPKGIITLFIVAMYEHIEQQQYVWKNGIVLKKDSTRAEVVEYYNQRKIIIRVAGANKRSLLTIITQTLDKINHSYQKIYTVNGFMSENK